MLPPAEILQDAGSLASDTIESERAAALMLEQSGSIREHFTEVGPEHVYEQALAEAATRRQQVTQRAEKAREKHASREDVADARHSDDN